MCGFNSTGACHRARLSDQAIRVIVSVPAGGTPDVMARSVTPGMSTLLGQQLVLDNRGGAGGRIASDCFVALRFTLREQQQFSASQRKKCECRIDFVLHWKATSSEGSAVRSPLKF